MQEKFLAHYEILDKLGEGGMGEVYRARDTKLKRDVAIKVLPVAFAADPDRLKRFEREAQLLASLNHPNIAAIYGLEQHESTHFLVLELVEGVDLSERLERGPIPVDEALAIARQIAEALEEAHDKGVIHRDLKPGNVKLTADGRVKVLDFGLAKAFGIDSEVGASADLSQSPTMTRQATMAGVILGTAGYMSPEQARGKPVDKRTDIWAFGVVLFEMLTGRRLFEGDTVSDRLAAVLRAEIDWNVLPTGISSSVRRLLRRSLSRDPKSRLRDAGDARLELTEAEWGDVEGPRAERSNRLPWSLAAVLALALISAFLMRGGSTDTEPVLRVDIAPPADTEFVWFSPPALSPDGSELAFVGRNAEGVQRIYIRDFASGVTEALPGTENASFPFWSPDGEWLGFFAERKLKKIPAGGGTSLELADVTQGRGGTWSQGGTIVFAPAAGGGLMRVAASGGDVEAVTRIGAWSDDAFSHRLPSFLPDGRHFLYSAHTTTGYSNSGVLVGSLDSLEPEFIVNALSARYASGQLLFVREQMLMAQAFDTGTRSLVGESMPLVQGVLPMGASATGVFTASEQGELIYALGDFARSRLEWVDREGQHLGYFGEPGAYGGVSLSPDGRWAVLAQSDEAVGGYDLNLWLYDVADETGTRFTFDATFNMWPLWSPDSTMLVYSSLRDMGSGLYRQSVTGAGTEELLFGSGFERLVPSGWSPDGSSIAFRNGDDLWILPLDDEFDAYAYLHSEDRESFGVFSLDGRWLAYVSDETGRNEVFVTSFPEPGRKWQVSKGGGEVIWWIKEELIYQDPTGMLVAVRVETAENTFIIRESRELFRGPPPSVVTPTVSPTLDAERFLLVTEESERTDDPLTLVVNWPAMLER